MYVLARGARLTTERNSGHVTTMAEAEAAQMIDEWQRQLEREAAMMPKSRAQAKREGLLALRERGAITYEGGGTLRWRPGSAPS